MQSAEGKFLRQRYGKGYAARVSVSIELQADESRIDIACIGKGWQGQGSIEEASEEGYTTWKQGAITGVKYALQVANCLQSHVIITRILGMTTDTNPTIVAVAATFAIWEALGFTPPSDVEEKLEGLALTSWDNDHSVVPKLD